MSSLPMVQGGGSDVKLGTSFDLTVSRTNGGFREYAIPNWVEPSMTGYTLVGYLFNSPNTAVIPQGISIGYFIYYVSSSTSSTVTVKCTPVFAKN